MSDYLDALFHPDHPLMGMDDVNSTRNNIFGGQDFYNAAGQQTGMTMQNVLGGYDYYDAGGKYLGHSRENVFGGQDFFDAEGHYLGHNRENIAGGHDFISADGSEYVHSQDNPQGGHIYLGSDGQIGESRANIFGGEDYTWHGQDLLNAQADWQDNLINNYDDPLSQIKSWSFPPLV